MENRILSYLLLTLVVLMPVMETTAQTKEKNMSALHLTTREFKEKVYNFEANPNTFKYEGSMPAIVDFFATWCGPCQALGPVLDELAKEYEGRLLIYKVDVDKNEELSQLFGIRSVPTLLYIPKEGQPYILPGAPSKAQLKQIIENMIK